MNKYLLYMFLMLGTIQQFHSQESNGIVALTLPVRNSLKFNRYALNPTFSFVREQNKYISFTNKRQWVQFNNAPESYLFSYSGRFAENIGAGVGLFQQNFGVFSTFGGMLNFAYNANFSDDSNLTFGLNVGAYQSGINQGELIFNSTDTSLENVPSSFILTVNPGINYGVGFLDFGLSINNLITYNLNTSEIIEENPEQAFQAHVMYTGYMNSRGFFDESKFSTLIRSEFKQDQTVLSGVAMLTVPKGIWAQAGYNTLFGASAGLGMNVTKNIAIEYNYEQSMGDLSEFGSSHEITIAYRFDKKYRYNYGDDDQEQSVFNSKTKKVKANSISAEERARVAERRAAIEAERKARADAKKVANTGNTETKKDKEVANVNLDENEINENTKIITESKEAEAAKLIEEARLVEENKKRLEQEKITAEIEAKTKLDEEKRRAEAEAKLEEQQKAEVERKRLEAEIKRKAEAATTEEARLEQEKQKRLEQEKIKAEVEAKRKLDEERIRAEVEANAKLEEQQKAEVERKRIEAETKRKAAVTVEEARLEEEKNEAEKLQANKDIKEEIKPKKEVTDVISTVKENPKLEEFQDVPESEDEESKTLKALAEATTKARNEQRELLNNLSNKIAIKQQDLNDLKEENDLSEQGIYQAPKKFKSVTAENATIEGIKDEIEKVEEEQEAKMIELEALLIKRKRKFRKDRQGINDFYKDALEQLKGEQLRIKNYKAALINNLEKIKVATDFERKRRISRAAYDNQEDRYNKDKATLDRIKKFTDESATPLKEEDFDFGEEQTKNIQIVSNVLNEASGYYMVIAVHDNVAKRDEFVTKVVASGEKNVNFFFDVKTNKYFIYYEKFNQIGAAKNALQQKGNKPYNGKMSLVKIEN